MAYISGKYTSATEYSITLGGMAIGTVYAILVQDLNSDGSSNGFVCKWKSGATSSTHTVKYTTKETYSRYDRKIGFFQGSFSTDVGRRITDDQFNSWADGTGTISAWGYVLEVASDGWPSILDSVKVTSGTFTLSNNTINYSTRQYITQINLTGTAINNRWTGNIYWKNASGSRFLVATVTNGSVSLASSIEPIDCTGNRTISFVAEGSQNTGTRVYLRCGIGISSYIVQYTDYDGIVTNKTISSTSNTYIDVKENSTIYASSPNYVTDYEGPYYFQQWSTDFGSVTTENIGTDVTVGSTSLYLKLVGVHRPWEVTYDANGGTWTSSVTNPELVEYLGKASITDYSLAVSRKNYKLLGWFTSATGGTQWAATNIVQQDMTLYAQWEQWEAPFKFRLSDTNEGLVSFQVNRYASQGGALLESKTISSTNFIEIVARDSNYIEITNAIIAVIKDGTKEINRNGFTAPLITARADNSSNQDQNEYLKIQTEGSVTQSPVYGSYGFRAGLRPNHHTFLVGSFAKSYKYSLDANEGYWTNESTNPKKSSVKSTERVDFSKYSSLVKRIGYKLEGWGLSATGGKVTVPNGKYWITDDTNFYAIWAARQVLVYNYDGGRYGNETGSSSIYVDKGSTFEVNRVPSKDGYSFVGWKRTYDNKIYQEGQTFIIQAEKEVLTAQWEAPFKFRLSDTNEGLVSFQVNRYASQGGALLESKTISSTNFIEIVARDSNYIEITNAIIAVIKDGTKEINRNGFTAPLITARADNSSNQDQNEYLKIQTEGSVTQSPVYGSYGFRAGLRPNHHTFLVGSFAKSYKYSLDANEGYWTNESTNPKKSSVKSTERVDFSKYSSLVKRIGCELEGWGLSATGGKVTVPNGKYWITDDTNFYAVWTKNIGLFYWDGNTGATDSSIIAKGLPITNLTAERWNRLREKILVVATARANVTAINKINAISTVQPTDTLTANMFNDIREAIALLEGSTTLPNKVKSNEPVLASYFNGTTSLKSALNAAITAWNNL